MSAQSLRDLTQRCTNAIRGRLEDRTMKRSAGFLTVLMFSAVVTILLTNSSSAMGGNCQDKLVGNSYDCVFELSNGTTETTCVDFEMGGSPRLLIFIAFAMTWTTDARARRHALSSRL